MKKLTLLAAVLVLTLASLTGCGCRNSRPAETTMPTSLPTVTTSPTQAPTIPTTMDTEPSTTATIPDGNGPISTDAPAGTDSALPGTGNGITGSITG